MSTTPKTSGLRKKHHDSPSMSLYQAYIEMGDLAAELENEVRELRAALECIRDECFSGHAYDIAVRAIGEYQEPSKP
jgi:hypothetical protein